MKKPMLLFAFVAVACALAVAGCTKKSSETAAPVEMTVEQLSQRGRTVYLSNCTACHNVDPAQDGAVGPAVFGSSQELLEARLVRAEYPAGYKPKRDTRSMLALPHLEKEIPGLTAFLGGASGTPR
jgi:mono/diheme cytochrome c family protein